MKEKRETAVQETETLYYNSAIASGDAGPLIEGVLWALNNPSKGNNYLRMVEQYLTTMPATKVVQGGLLTPRQESGVKRLLTGQMYDRFPRVRAFSTQVLAQNPRKESYVLFPHNLKALKRTQALLPDLVPVAQTMQQDAHTTHDYFSAINAALQNPLLRTETEPIFYEHDPLRRFSTMCEYMSMLPPGDYCTQLLTPVLFPVASGDITPRTGMEKVAALLESTEYLAQYLVAPYFFEEYPADPGIDKNIAEATYRMGSAGVEHLMLALYGSLLMGAQARERLNPGSLEVTPFTRALLSHEASSPDDEMVVIDYAMQQLLHRNKQGLMEYMARRFKTMNVDPHVSHLLVRDFGIYSTPSAVEYQNKGIGASIEKLVGKAFLERLAHEKDALASINELAHHSLTHLTNALPINEQQIVMTPEHSLQQSLGIGEIIYLAKSDHDRVQFVLRLTPVRQDIIGSVSLSGASPFSISVDFSSDIPGLQELLEYIVCSTLHDLMTRYCLPRKSESTRNASLNRGGESSSSEHYTRIPRTERTHHHHLSDIQREIALSSGREPRKIGMYLRSLPGAAAYAEACEWYRENPNEENQARLAEARNKLSQPREEKREAIMTLPPQYIEAMQSITDPVTQETAYLKTWVKEHYNPALTQEEQRSLVELYERRYIQKGAPHSELLDHIHSWILGIDH